MSELMAFPEIASDDSPSCQDFGFVFRYIVWAPMAQPLAGLCSPRGRGPLEQGGGGAPHGALGDPSFSLAAKRGGPPQSKSSMRYLLRFVGVAPPFCLQWFCVLMLWSPPFFDGFGLLELWLDTFCDACQWVWLSRLLAGLGSLDCG